MKKSVLTAFVFILTCLSPYHSQAVYYYGLWTGGTDANYLNVGMDLPTFTDLASQRIAQGLHVINVDTYLENGVRKWSAVWRSGTGANYVNVGLTLSEFSDLVNQRFSQNLRVIDILTYVDGRVRKYGGVWVSGSDANYVNVNLSLAEFTDLVNQRFAQNLRIVDIETYLESGVRKWAAVWRSGTDANYVNVDLSFSDFQNLEQQRRAQNLRLVDFETYEDAGVRKWAGVWRSGTSSSFYASRMDLEKLTAEARDGLAKDLRIIQIGSYDPVCGDACQNTLIMPTGFYDYGITATGLHCEGLPGSCPAPASGAVVYYHAPFDVSGSSRFVRLSAVEVPDRFLTLPFVNDQVKPRGIWRYSSGDWHHAADYSRDDADTFKVRAAAAGTVLHVGWDLWSGNTIVISHDVGGVADSYRTIYMHLRNGPLTDCDAAWSKTVPWMATVPDLSDELTAYRALLNSTGCPKTVADRNPDPANWGTASQTIQVTAGQTVFRGQFLAWAGQTGPGGNRGTSLNTHLHIFFARRDPVNDRWYFFDPYGIYGLPSCYPSGTTDPIATDCVRYPIAWEAGAPGYPVLPLDFKTVSARAGKELELSWEIPTAKLQYTTDLSARWTTIQSPPNPFRIPLSDNLKIFYRLIQ